MNSECKWDELNTWMSQLPGHFYWKDIDGCYVGATEGILKIFGLEKKGLIGKTDRQLWPEEAGVLKTYDEQVLTSRKSMTVEETITVDNHQQKTLLVTRLPWYDDSGNIIGIIGNLLNITVQKKKELMLKKNLKETELELKKIKEESLNIQKIKNDFLEELYLNIHAPTEQIVHATKLIQDETDNDKVREYAKTIITSTQDLQNFLNKIIASETFDKKSNDKISEKSVKIAKLGSAKESDQLSNLNAFKIPVNTSDNVRDCFIAEQKENLVPRYILIVEDHPITAKITKTILTDLNCQVDIAINGESAIFQMQNECYDLALMDIGLPDIDGCEVTKQVRLWESTKDKPHIPIIGLTARVDNQNKQRSIDAGMNAVFSKPLTKEKVFDIFMSFIPKYNVQSETKVSLKLVEAPQPDNTNKSKSASHLENSIVDLTLGANLIGGDEELAKEAIIMMVHSFSEDLIKLEKAYQESNWCLVQMVIHKLRGGTSYCGTPRLKEACIRLDEYLKTGNTTEVSTLYQHLLKEVEAIKQLVLQW